MAYLNPPTLQALTLEAFWNRRFSSCSTDGHPAPYLDTEAREGATQAVALRPVQCRRIALASPRASLPLTVIPAQAGIQ
jgi:hypothetical protein